MGKFSFGDITTWDSSEHKYIAVAEFDSSYEYHLIFYTDAGDSDKAKARVVRIINDEPIVYAAVTIDSNASCQYLSCCNVNQANEEIILVWVRSGALYTGWVTRDGTSLDATVGMLNGGATQMNDPAGEDKGANAIAKINTDQAVLVYYNDEDPDEEAWVICCDISDADDDVDFGAGVEIHGTDVTNGQWHFSATQLDSDKVLVSYYDDDDDRIYVSYIVPNVALPAIQEDSSDHIADITNSSGNTLITHSTTEAILVYENQTDTDMDIADISSGNVVLSDLATQFLDSTASGLFSAVKLAASNVLVVYGDNDNSGYGSVNVVTEAAGALSKTTADDFREKDCVVSTAYTNMAVSYVSLSNSLYKVLVVYINDADGVAEARLIQYQSLPTAQKYVYTYIAGSKVSLRVCTLNDADYHNLRVRIGGTNYEFDLVDDNPPFNTFPVRVRIGGTTYQIRDDSAE